MNKGIFFNSKSWKLSLTGLENMLYLAEIFWLSRMFPDLKNYIYGLYQIYLLHLHRYLSFQNSYNFQLIFPIDFVSKNG